jgi:hypothetical protein
MLSARIKRESRKTAEARWRSLDDREEDVGLAVLRRRALRMVQADPDARLAAKLLGADRATSEYNPAMFPR